MRKILSIHFGLLLLFVAILAALDASLQLGTLQGLVFTIYTVYFTLLLVLINWIAASWQWYRKEFPKMRTFLWSGGLVLIVGIILAYSLPPLFTSF